MRMPIVTLAVSWLTLSGSVALASGSDGLNPLASRQVLYELQVQSANACDPDTGADWQRARCRAKAAPKFSQFPFTARGGKTRNDCPAHELDRQGRIKLGTLEDMLEDTDDFEAAISLKYIREKVGPVMVWIQPPFPRNERENIPWHCDVMGSPYAVRDYMHISGKLSRVCITKDQDENSTDDGKPVACWGTRSFETVVRKAKELGLKVMLDVAFNHFGHNYQFYDYESFTPVRDRIARGENLEDLKDYGKTWQDYLLYPVLIDTEAKLNAAASRTENGRLTPNAQAIRNELAAVRAHCAAKGVNGLAGDDLVRVFGMWRDMMAWERDRFDCKKHGGTTWANKTPAGYYLDAAAPGFFLGEARWDNGWKDIKMSMSHEQKFKDDEWPDVKFLFLHEWGNKGSWEYQTYVRNREYLFRILNYWSAVGVDGFRLDHTTDPRSGISPDMWRYVLTKLNRYAKARWEQQGRRGEFLAPVILAEEFGDQQGMSYVADAITDGFIGDIRNGITRDTAHVERAVGNMDRFGKRILVMRGLENHDEHRATASFKDDPWLAAGFWAAVAAVPGLPNLHAGQEFGEGEQLSFKQATFLSSRFVGTRQYRRDARALIDFYGRMVKARTAWENRALWGWDLKWLKSNYTGERDARIFAQARWSWLGGGNSTIFTFNNLWDGQIAQHFFLPEDVTKAIQLDQRNPGEKTTKYKVVDALTGQRVPLWFRKDGDVSTPGPAFREWFYGQHLAVDFGVTFPLRRGDDFNRPWAGQPDSNWRVQWLRLETE